MFGDKDFYGDKNDLSKYKTGKSRSEAIPLVWYQEKTRYPTVTYTENNQQKVARIGDRLNLGGKAFQVNRNNIIEPGHIVRKANSRGASRANQQSYNQVFNSNAGKVGSRNTPAIGPVLGAVPGRPRQGPGIRWLRQQEQLLAAGRRFK
ncbi:MAG: hypothetical protein AAF998_18130 [Bacteroidota bacterium]